ncbi:hypothetical protein [Saccharopolyspora spinosa]|uniref:hypothetical protein n=1 Tax=Saccharopolyspora spinosa TaxID=60894 RepID=UPI0002378FC0|nr:hypothetical protein [Saccharopolyspora spinosa]
MTVTEPDLGVEEQNAQSLSTAAARNLATTTKSQPQMQGTTSRWLLRMLPWVDVSAGTYRVNRRLTYAVGDGRITFTNTGADVRVIPQELGELPLLRGFDDDSVLGALADRFEQREFEPGQVINVHGEADIEVASGHSGEPTLAGTYVDYELAPREYELSVAQTVLRVHSRVADLYNQPMNQTEQQLRLTIEALRERQEMELINNRDFGLLHNADLRQRIHTRTGPPTPDDLDELLSRRRKTRFFLAHPQTIAAFGRECNRRGISRTGPPTPDDLDELLSRRRKTRFFLAHPQTIAAFGRECNRRGIYPRPTEVQGRQVHAWRGVPLLPSDKIPISDRGTSSILAMRTGEDDQGVVGLQQTGVPDEYRPGLSVRFMGINDQAVISYLVSTYFSTAVLVPDALGVLERVEIAR